MTTKQWRYIQAREPQTQGIIVNTQRHDPQNLNFLAYMDESEMVK